MNENLNFLFPEHVTGSGIILGGLKPCMAYCTPGCKPCCWTEALFTRGAGSFYWKGHWGTLVQTWTWEASETEPRSFLALHKCRALPTSHHSSTWPWPISKPMTECHKMYECVSAHVGTCVRAC